VGQNLKGKCPRIAAIQTCHEYYVQRNSEKIPENGTTCEGMRERAFFSIKITLTDSKDIKLVVSKEGPEFHGL